jgi:ribonucleotide monophosphatase NagD (HAD superfamily)
MMLVAVVVKISTFARNNLTLRSTAATSRVRIIIQTATVNMRKEKGKAPGVGRLVHTIAASITETITIIGDNTDSPVILKSMFEKPYM